MDEHLSWLVADEIAAGLVRPPAHAQSCPACQARLQNAVRARGDALKAPEFGWRWQRISAALPPSMPWWRAWLPAAAGLALAAALVLVISPRTAGERFKGGPAIELRLASTGARVTRAPLQSRVWLMIGAPGHRYGLVMSVEGDGKVEEVWSGELPLSIAKVGPALEVTPGKTMLFAFFGDQPLSAEAARAALLANRLSPARIAGEQARAATSLEPLP